VPVPASAAAPVSGVRSPSPRSAAAASPVGAARPSSAARAGVAAGAGKTTHVQCSGPGKRPTVLRMQRLHVTSRCGTLGSPCNTPQRHKYSRTELCHAWPPARVHAHVHQSQSAEHP
jgi:hypothetical protein